MTALQDFIAREYPSLPLVPLTEVARNVLRQYHFTREDIMSSPQKALELQQLILAAQYNEETKGSGTTILSDRSGVDPIVYGIQYGPAHSRELLEASFQWPVLRDKMRKSLVIVCPPQAEWFKDDGIRLMASQEEWEGTHLTFLQILKEYQIPFHTIPVDLVILQDRVDFAISVWRTFRMAEAP